MGALEKNHRLFVSLLPLKIVAKQVRQYFLCIEIQFTMLHTQIIVLKSDITAQVVVFVSVKTRKGLQYNLVRVNDLEPFRSI